MLLSFRVFEYILYIHMLFNLCRFLLLFFLGGAESGQLHDLISLEQEKQKTLSMQKSLETLKAGEF